ncbi:MAG TPA: DUF1345 domain-containing protein [Kofleriaceae bacterium]|nr:DUF1345 domain-containing protein [Kofleriaceae bacterium]
MTSLAFHPLDPRGARARLLVAVVLGTLAGLVVPGPSATARAVIGWDVAGLTLLALGLAVSRTTAEGTRRRAAARDPGRTFVWVVVLAASAVSMLAATVIVHQGAQHPGVENRLLLVLSVVTILVSWFLTHTAFTLRYAHLYYRTKDGEGGIEFPGGEAPDDFDFAYFAFTIGVCFQVSDATISNRTIRRTVLAHALISFAYNTVVFALTVNLIVGHLG